MRTAEQILRDNNGDAIAAINEGRREAIEEAAKSAEANYEIDDDMWEAAVVDETSITKLIRELK